MNRNMIIRSSRAVGVEAFDDGLSPAVAPLSGESRGPGQERRPLDGADARHRPADDLQLRGPHLVRETRKVTFKPGANPLQFSWANTLIDPTSVELRFRHRPDKLDVLDTTFPHDKPQMLYWNVQSEIDGEATIEITYFTSGISWSADYLCIAERRPKPRWASKASSG